MHGIPPICFGHPYDKPQGDAFCVQFLHSIIQSYSLREMLTLSSISTLSCSPIMHARDTHPLLSLSVFESSTQGFADEATSIVLQSARVNLTAVSSTCYNL